ncbi:hypothetical protein OHA77_32150 [Streptosporangium sp. NBC_01639]|uniref:hypothetical protein n=1 Tax=Streptosporangium sp. NBC_01639 TaxID=2975948 RepID=UPI0038645317|nr:hypothetical protein OHA77_32150 [Streptosporangium sp. NBC_01639]
MSGGPWRSITLVDLRYGDACLKEAVQDGRRPHPTLVGRRTVVYSWARADPCDRFVSRWAAIEERRERQLLRRSAGVIRQMVNARVDGRLAVEAVEDFDVPPATHRRSAIWLA